MSGFFRFECKVISRKGRKNGNNNSSLKAASYISGKAIKAASYISGQEIADADYSHKKGVLASWVVLNENAPEEWKNPEKLWNSVENVEKGANADLFREFIICFDSHLAYKDMITVSNQFAQSLINEGMAAVHLAIHDEKDGNGNFHVHMLCPTRGLNDNGMWQEKKTYPRKYAIDADGNRIPVIDKKTGEQKIYNGRKMWKREPLQYIDSWNDRKNNNVTRWRQTFCDIENQYLPPENQVTPKSYREQGIDKIPGIHLSKAEYAMRKKLDRIINSLSDEERKQFLSVLEHVVNEEYRRMQHRHFSFIGESHLQMAKEFYDVISYYRRETDTKYMQQDISEAMLETAGKLSQAENDLISSFVYEPTRQILVQLNRFQKDVQRKQQQHEEVVHKKRKHHIHR